MKPQVTKEAENEQGADTETAATSKRKQVSKRLFLKADGTEAEKMEDADGGRYVLLDPNGNHDLDYQFGSNPNVDKMFAIFGYHTKIGNVANTVLNDKDEPGTPSDAAAAIREFLAALAGGVWAERTTGGVGTRVDKDALAGAIVHVAESTGTKRWAAEMAKDGATPDSARGAIYAEVRAKLESDAAYLRDIRKVPPVAAEYAARVGKQAKSLDDLL